MPIAHRDALDEPVGHLCLNCFASGVQLTGYEEGCVICGEAAEYHTVRELSDFDGETILATGTISVCEGHIDEFAESHP